MSDLGDQRIERLENGFDNYKENDSYEKFSKIAYSDSTEIGISKVLENIEKEILIEAVKLNKNFARAADKINITRSSISQKIKKYNIAE